MIWVIHILVISLLLIISLIFEEQIYFYYTSTIYVLLVFGQRWMVGVDFRNYLIDYIRNRNQKFELGYQTIQNILRSNNIYFGVFIFICLAISWINFYRFFKKFGVNGYIMLFFFMLLELFFIQMSQIRQMLAVSFFVNAYLCSYENKKISSVFNLIIGSLFHSSIIMIAPLLLIKPTFKKKTYMLILLVIALLPFIDITIILRLLLEMLNITRFSTYIGGRFDVSLSPAHLPRYYISVLFTCFYLQLIEFPEKNKKNWIFSAILTGHFFHLGLYGSSFFLAPILRISNFFKIFEIVFFVYMWQYLKPKKIVFLGEEFKIKKVLFGILAATVFGLYVLNAIFDSYGITNFQLKRLYLYEGRTVQEIQDEVEYQE